MTHADRERARAKFVGLYREDKTGKDPQILRHLLKDYQKYLERFQREIVMEGFN